MNTFIINHQLLTQHPIFKSCVIVDVVADVKNKTSINFGRIYLTFVFGNVTSKNYRGFNVPMPKVQLRPVSNYHEFSASKGNKIIILGIRTSRWFAMVKKPARLFNESNIDMYKVLPASILDPLYKSCKNISDPNKIIELLDTHLQPYYKKWNRPCPIDDILDEIFEKQGVIKLNYLMDKYPFSKSSFYNYFQKYVGYSPKFFIRLVQFNNIIREVENNGDRLSTLIRAYNFYDYAHFKRDFQVFTGVNPMDYPNFKEGSMFEVVIKNIDYS